MTENRENMSNIRRHARAVITAAFISSLKNVEKLKESSGVIEPIQTIHRKTSRPKMISTQTETDLDSPKFSVVSFPKINDKTSKLEQKHEKTIPRKPWNPLTDGRRAIMVMIDQVWAIPYAPAQYAVQFMCAVHLCRMKRHKYCVRWQNGRRSAIFYVNIDENEKETDVWVNFPGEIKLQRPHTSHSHFQRFLQRHLF